MALAAEYPQTVHGRAVPYLTPIERWPLDWFRILPSDPLLLLWRFRPPSKRDSGVGRALSSDLSRDIEADLPVFPSCPFN